MKHYLKTLQIPQNIAEAALKHSSSNHKNPGTPLKPLGHP